MSSSIGESLGEGLFASSTIRLFGRPFLGLALGEKLGEPATGNNPLVQALRTASADASSKPMLARIYGFSYLGNYFKLAEPLVLLVYGPGTSLKAEGDTMSFGGIEFKCEHFTDGVQMWAVDQLDISIRIDITIGWMKDILLAQEMGADNNVTGGDVVRRSDIVGRDGSLVGRDGSFVGRDGSFVGRDGSFAGRR